MEKQILSKYPLSFYAGQQVRRLRKKAGMTTSDLAILLGVSQQQLSRYERGVNRIDIDTLSHLSELFNVSIHYFLEGEDENNIF
ncbi:helix-turn-helix domain-containing protein [Providencia rettgeri]|uniref:helix-turn-helix domain-containing protein n=1 Tax=Providencia rettgeri TaxID=587 RepID=UPI00029C6717|nr:helix-turn-helix transcriptional regulator [Providencia rettgeri]EKT60427.1 transcriptional regulator [Providencia rettgeri Dmel1]